MLHCKKYSDKYKSTWRETYCTRGLGDNIPYKSFDYYRCPTNSSSSGFYHSISGLNKKQKLEILENVLNPYS